MSIDEKILNMVGKLKEVRQKKEAHFRQQRAAKDRAIKVEDMVRRMNKVGPTELPFPSRFCMDQMEKHFGSLEKIDLGKSDHLAAVIFFLRNSENVDIADYDAARLKKEILKTSTWPEEHTVHYIENVSQIFLALKKKSTRYQMSQLENLVRTLGIDLQAAADGRN